MYLKKIIFKVDKLKSIIRCLYYKYLGANILKNVTIASNCKIYNHENLVIKDYVFINDNFWCNAKGGVNIGSDVLIGPNVTIHSSNHNYSKSNVKFRLQGHTNKKVTIGNNVWLCASVVILPGVSICNDVIVAAGSIVTSDIKNRGVYAGVPAKFIKNI